MRPATPRERIEAECARRGKAAVVAGCAALVLGGETDSRLVWVLGGPTTRWALEGGPEYWFRVWGARGLLWAWDDTALPALTAALADQAWRVRELAAKVAARHLVGVVLTEVAALRDDPVPRVRAAATRAVARLTRAGA